MKSFKKRTLSNAILFIIGLCVFVAIGMFLFPNTRSKDFEIAKNKANQILTKLSEGEDPTVEFRVSLYCVEKQESQQKDRSCSLKGDNILPIDEIESILWTKQDTGTVSEFLTSYNITGEIKYKNSGIKHVYVSFHGKPEKGFAFLTVEN